MEKEGARREQRIVGHSLHIQSRAVPGVVIMAPLAAWGRTSFLLLRIVERPCKRQVSIDSQMQYMTLTNDKQSTEAEWKILSQRVDPPQTWNKSAKIECEEAGCSRDVQTRETFGNDADAQGAVRCQ